MTNISDKAGIAKAVADAHRKCEPSITRIVRVITDQEQATDEPVKLLEVNPDTTSSGILPIALDPKPPRIPFPSVVIEVTQAEFESIRAGGLRLPDGWRLGDTLYPDAANGNRKTAP
jgi:hypothetical protein